VTRNALRKTAKHEIRFILQEVLKNNKKELQIKSAEKSRKNEKMLLTMILLLALGLAWAQIIPIKDIQNTTLPNGDSPLKGQIVTISGVVTGETYAFGGK
jgi:hypothetical protein